ncbi:UNKNOWN [Stylonychia lemnae]|uniref:Uncharacterized protein n=1 Tax=Stylonychia lemnae TaxID=5949 RepID=A0A078BE97_STYLE|nr:UNKNOWN [Stylonychia lemnae]|eukprot:CDW91452.1 UNKNOWN [Stylonychia lemnae]
MITEYLIHKEDSAQPIQKSKNSEQKILNPVTELTQTIERSIPKFQQLINQESSEKDKINVVTVTQEEIQTDDGQKIDCSYVKVGKQQIDISSIFIEIDESDIQDDEDQTTQGNLPIAQTQGNDPKNYEQIKSQNNQEFIIKSQSKSVQENLIPEQQDQEPLINSKEQQQKRPSIQEIQNDSETSVKKANE